MEIVIGASSVSEIQEFADWIKIQHERDQVSFPCTTGLSMDVEDQQTSLYDVYGMCGVINMPEKKRLLSEQLEGDIRPGLSADKWRQIPAKIMFGNGID